MATYAHETLHAEGATDLMKRAHRKSHLFLWLVLGPAMIAALFLAVQQRPAEPVNDDLPVALLEEAL